MKNTIYKDRNDKIIKLGDIITFYHHGNDYPKQFNPLCYGIVEKDDIGYYIDDNKMCPYLSFINIGEIKEP